MQYIKRSSPQFKKSSVKNDAYYTKGEVELILNDTCEDGNAHENSNRCFLAEKVLLTVAILTPDIFEILSVDISSD